MTSEEFQKLVQEAQARYDALDLKSTTDFWADWLVDAVATATQDRRYLRGSPQEDRIATEAILACAKKAMENLLKNRGMTP